ncbi:ROK family protein [Ginsengibacter hankyongi]|uniref:fructokinase n=1 Tax=Ginsengibacter hankyongi TaxID=2607284 RepID=A0A5J5IDT1_9BACT|nr:ROK family protein [Ginsengibacter hankyongi]KAA9036537.1 ROK family protein [Ginsengibacter hankyongi]
MMQPGKYIGLDVGGSHVTASLIDTCITPDQPLHLLRKDINAFGKAFNIITDIGSCINEILIGDIKIDAVGIAFPGPFNYEKGVCAIANVGGKFEQTFGLHVKQALKDITGLNDTIFRFSNDAHCFATGAFYRHQLSSKRTVFLTLGTGFGSAFMKNEVLLYNDPALPASGTFYDQDFLLTKADDYFSTRWFLNEYRYLTGKEISSVKELVNTDPEIATSIFWEFGSNLGYFLLPWLQQFECDELVIGGNISKANEFFVSSLKKRLGIISEHINIVFCDDTEDCILTGAAILAAERNEAQVALNKRKTTQHLLPVTSILANHSSYNIFPSFHSDYEVNKGFNSLADKISIERIVTIDGYGGVLWGTFRQQLHKALSAKKKSVFWYDINACLKSPGEIEKMIEENLNGDDPVFGKKYKGSLADFFDNKKLELLHPDPDAEISIVYGTGATLSNWQGLLVYADVPKNEIQYRMRAGSINNIGSSKVSSNTQMYKRFYFVDWPVLNKHKEQLLNKIHCIVDEQRIDEITWMDGNDFRNTLNEILQQPFRARPWFEAGVWGGDWMKKNITGLNKEEINYAWSFELITPENGIVIEGNKNLLEISFDFLLFFDNNKLLGRAAMRFGTEFPIRFDFLDTYDGGNLSIQCHPRTNYIREKFGENFTQDETYYILDCEPDAKVYLGFQNDIDPCAFKTALLDAQNTGVEMQAEKYVQKHAAHKHDLFLIPNGTIHASGKNNMVLEISSTPYIYTFKMYDWLRLDLNGQARPINIDHAFNNLYFDRKGSYVQDKLISHPVVEQEWKGGRKIKLPTHEEHFYTVDRYEFTGEVQINTNNQCHVCMLVEGDRVEVTVNKKTTPFHYAETFVIPASIENYSVHYRGNAKAFLVVAYVKEECCFKI